MTTTDAALLAICRSFVEAVKAAGEIGAPGGVMYAAVCDKLTIGQFESIMRVLVQTGRIRRSGHLYHFVADL